MMEIYFDNSATTKCNQQAAELMIKILTEDYGNPSSMHKKGVDAEKHLNVAKKFFAENLKVQEKELVFTSCGTESDNLALIGTAMANRREGNLLITSRIEHPAILSTMKFLEKQGFQVTYLDVDKYGIVDLEQLEQAITSDTILVSVMHVNNEIGAVEPLEDIANIIKRKNPKTYFHVDSVQGYGKFPVYPKRMGIDMLSISGHKIHGPKGIGLLYINSRVKIVPTFYGGGQQKDMRSGTENVAGIAAMAEAAKALYTDFDKKTESLYQLREYFIKEVLKIEGTQVNGFTDRRNAPHIVSVSFDGIGSEVLLHSLEDRGIYVSSGSACASNKQAASDTLSAIGLTEAKQAGTLRFSFCFDNTKEEVDICMQVLQELLPKLRKYTRR